MRLLHTSDWHLGHTLRDWSREHEHAAFLRWLTDTLEAEQVDALVIAGDVFDTSNPSASAEECWYRFLAETRARLPSLNVVVIAGNHDSAARLEAPLPVLSALGVTVVGALPRRAESELERLVVPLTDREGKVGALLAAVPFLRPSDIPNKVASHGEGEAGCDPLIEGVRKVYTRVLDEIRARRSPGQAMLAAGHLYMVGGEVSELSERKVLGGNQHALPADIFPDDVAYAALGHLHLAQRIGGRDCVRYSGAPLPLSINEASYPHQVVLLDLKGEGVEDLRTLKVPTHVSILRVPSRGALPLAEAVQQLKELDAPASLPVDKWPFLEVEVELTEPVAGLLRQIEEAISGKGLRLVRVGKLMNGSRNSLRESARYASLRDMTPEQVFRARYDRDHQGEVSEALLSAFHELLDEVHQGGRRA